MIVARYGVAVAAVLMTAGPFWPALAQELVVQQSRDQHCVIELAADGHERVGDAQCFDDADSALAAATGVAVPTGLSARVEEMGTWIDSYNVLAAPTTVLSREYDGGSYTGSTLTYKTSNPNGCNGTTYSDSQLSGWNNRIESVKAYAGCTVRHYDGYNFSGSSFGCSIWCASLGSMNNKTSSIRHS